MGNKEEWDAIENKILLLEINFHRFKIIYSLKFQANIVALKIKFKIIKSMFKKILKKAAKHKKELVTENI